MWSLCCKLGVWQDHFFSPPTYLGMSFITCCKATVQLVFRSFPERIVPYVAVHSVCPWKKFMQDFPKFPPWMAPPLKIFNGYQNMLRLCKSIRKECLVEDDVY